MSCWHFYILVLILYGESVFEVEFCGCIVIIINRCCEYSFALFSQSNSYHLVAHLAESILCLKGEQHHSTHCIDECEVDKNDYSW